MQDAESISSTGEDTVCPCLSCPQEITILVDGVKNSNFQEFRDYLEYHAANYKELNPHISVNVKQVDGDFVDLQDRLITEARRPSSSSSTWDGSIFPAQIVGPLVEANALWDLTDFVKTSAELNWPEISDFYRSQLAVYDRKVRLIPLDGDLLLMYYRKDLFRQYNITVPRTWEEYTQAAQFFHGKPVGPDSDEKLYGSCVSRIDRCGNAYWTSLIMSSMTQSMGTSSGFLLDPTDLNPLLGDALEETLQRLSQQTQYGHPEELTGSCLAANFDFNQGRCAMTYNWGNQISTIRGTKWEIGVAPTPGSTRVLDRPSGSLVNCTPELCPHGVYYEDIGQVNVAPYAAFGGWGAGVSNTIPLGRQLATANFFAYISNSNQSLADVLPNPRTNFAQPHRRSHLISKDWIETAGFSPTFAQEFTQSTRQVDSLNAVVELRIPASSSLRGVLDEEVFNYLLETSTNVIVTSEREAVLEQVTERIEERIRGVIAVENQISNTGMLESYQRSLGVFLEPPANQNYIDESFRSAGWGMAGLICGTSLLLMVWTFVNHNHKVIAAWQPYLLIQSCLGLFLLGATIVPLSLDDSLVSVNVLNIMCMLSPWTYVIGFTVLFSSVFAKIRQCKKVYDHPELYDVIRVEPGSACRLTFRLLVVNTVILFIWTTVDPLQWVREEVPDAIFSDSRMPDTFGVCKGVNNGFNAFAALLLVVNLSMCVVGIVQAFKCRRLQLEFNEVQWLPLVLLPFVEVWLLGVPILFLVEDDKNGNFVVLTLIITVSSLACMLALFAPIEWNFRKHGFLDASKASSRISSGHIVKKHPEYEEEKQLQQLQEKQVQVQSSNDHLENEIAVLKAKFADRDKTAAESRVVPMGMAAIDDFSESGSQEMREEAEALEEMWIMSDVEDEEDFGALDLAPVTVKAASANLLGQNEATQEEEEIFDAFNIDPVPVEAVSAYALGQTDESEYEEKSAPANAIGRNEDIEYQRNDRSMPSEGAVPFVTHVQNDWSGESSENDEEPIISPWWTESTAAVDEFRESSPASNSPGTSSPPPSSIDRCQASNSSTMFTSEAKETQPSPSSGSASGSASDNDNVAEVPTNSIRAESSAAAAAVAAVAAITPPSPPVVDSDDEESINEYKELYAAVESGDLMAIEKQASILADSFKSSDPRLSHIADEDEGDSGDVSQGFDFTNQSFPVDESIMRESEDSILQLDVAVGSDPTQQEEASDFASASASLSIVQDATSYDEASTPNQDGEATSSSSEIDQILASAGESSAAEFVGHSPAFQSFESATPGSESIELTQTAGEPSRGDLCGITNDGEEGARAVKHSLMKTEQGNDAERGAISRPVPLALPKQPLHSWSVQNSYVIGNWAAVGMTASMLNDTDTSASDSQSCSSYASSMTMESISSMNATQDASALDTPLATALDELVGQKDWDGVKRAAAEAEIPRSSLAEKRQKKRELEAWKASITKR
jgi:multiple sugar transport system substrate-binding protein